MQRRTLRTILAATAVILGTAPTAFAVLHPWHRPLPVAPPGPGNPWVYGGVIPKYGYDPHTAHNPYPWHAPAMKSGFRHYHMIPPPPPDALDHPAMIELPPPVLQPPVELHKPRNLP